MKTLPDSQLLHRYAERRSEAAFEELVRRHIGLVHSVAVRIVQEPHLAKDVTQGVFIAMARDAAKLAGHPAFLGWLHGTARNIAIQAVRGERRRQAREQAAVAMNMAQESGPDWEAVAPLLDAVIGELEEPDREAVLLRYFERKPADEMAAILGISAAAAQKRVNRAVERMRGLFAKRGVATGSSGLAAVIAAQAAPSVPLGLAAAVTEGALAAVPALIGISTATTTTLVMTLAQKSALVVAITILTGSCLYLALRDESSAGAAGAPGATSSSSSVAATKYRTADEERTGAGISGTGLESEARKQALASLKRRWLEIGNDDERKEEQGALAKETVETLSCSKELYDLAAFLEDRASYGLIRVEGELQILFRSPRGTEARALLAGLTSIAVEGIQDSRLEQWCYLAGRCCPVEAAEFEGFHAAIRNAACAQEAIFGWSLALAESDPEAAVATMLEAMKTDQASLHHVVPLEMLFHSDVKLPEDTDFAKLEAMFPPPDGGADARGGWVQAWGKRDPEAAADYVMAHPDRCDPGFIGSLRNVPGDPVLEEELAWANRFPAGPYFDTAAYGVADRLLWSNPEEAKKLAERIESAVMRKNFAEREELVRKIQSGEIREGG